MIIKKKQSDEITDIINYSTYRSGDITKGLAFLAHSLISLLSTILRNLRKWCTIFGWNRAQPVIGHSLIIYPWWFVANRADCFLWNWRVCRVKFLTFAGHDSDLRAIFIFLLGVEFLKRNIQGPFHQSLLKKWFQKSWCKYEKFTLTQNDMKSSHCLFGQVS